MTNEEDIGSILSTYGQPVRAKQHSDQRRELVTTPRMLARVSRYYARQRDRLLMEAEADQVAEVMQEAAEDAAVAEAVEEIRLKWGQG